MAVCVFNNDVVVQSGVCQVGAIISADSDGGNGRLYMCLNVHVCNDAAIVS